MPYKVTRMKNEKLKIKQMEKNIYTSDTEGLLQQDMKYLLVLRILYKMIHPNEYNSTT